MQLPNKYSKICLKIFNFQYKMPKSLSIDDVMRLVDTEEGDILVLKEIMKRDEESSGILSLSWEDSSLRNDSEITTTSTSFAMQEYSKNKHHSLKSGYFLL